MTAFIPDSTSTEKPLPVMGGDARPFWEGAREHRLMLQRCRECRVYQWFPRAMCRNCLSDRLVWEQASGCGTIYSYTVTYRGSIAAFFPPYVIALVELEEGIRVMSNIINCHPDAVRIGMPVEVAFEDWTPEISIMQFQPLRSRA